MKQIGKFWEVADFKDFVTSGKVEFLGIFRRFSAKNALFLYFCKVQILTRICLKSLSRNTMLVQVRPRAPVTIEVEPSALNQ